MYAITGATGNLGRFAVNDLLEKVPASEIVAIVRDAEKAADLAKKGVTVRVADYTKPETLGPALEGVDRLLLISGSEVGQRVPQHQAVIDAAKAAGVKLLAYTSILDADNSDMFLASEHAATEAAIKASGIPYVFLRNGWYNENYLGSIPMGVEHGALIGSAGEGKIAAAARADYAAAAAVVLAGGDEHTGKVYELAGDTAFTMADLAEAVAKASGKPVDYNNMPEEQYSAVLQQAGLPEPVANMLADSDTGASNGRLYNDSKTLSSLIGRPTTPITETVAAALKG